MREDGFYWVQSMGRWQIAFWRSDNQSWSGAGYYGPLTDRHFDTIGPRIPAPDEPTLVSPTTVEHLASITKRLAELAEHIRELAETVRTDG